MKKIINQNNELVSEVYSDAGFEVFNGSVWYTLDTLRAISIDAFGCTNYDNDDGAVIIVFKTYVASTANWVVSFKSIESGEIFTIARG
nr:MAG TPA: hypothetical protein [Caudoviricetes sp.]